MRGELVERSLREILYFDHGVTLFGLRIDRNILLQVAFEPALVIQRFANGDAIQPGLQRTPLAKTANPAKCLEEDFLSAVGRIGHIAKHAQNKIVDGTVIVRNKPVERGLGTRLQLRYEPGFVTAPR